MEAQWVNHIGSRNHLATPLKLKRLILVEIEITLFGFFSNLTILLENVHHFDSSGTSDDVSCSGALVKLQCQF